MARNARSTTAAWSGGRGPLTQAGRSTTASPVEYRYALSLDGDPVVGSDVVTPAPAISVRPTLLGITEQIIWLTIVVAAVRTLAISPLGAISLLPAAIVASWILRRNDMPPSWRVLGAVLLVVAWVLGAAILTGAFDGPRGL